jgi:hypothetical protein
MAQAPTPRPGLHKGPPPEISANRTGEPVGSLRRHGPRNLTVNTSRAVAWLRETGMGRMSRTKSVIPRPGQRG